MKYIKLFNESINTNSWIDEEFSSPEEVAKLIDSYFRDHEFTNLMSNMEELLSNVHPSYELVDQLMKYDDILTSVNTLIENYDEPWYLVQFEHFLEILVGIQDESKHGISIEEIEDLFLDLDYKYTITKINISSDNIPAFKVEIDKVTNSDSMILINRFWNTVGSRLPKEYQINNLKMDREKGGIYFTLVISKRDHESYQ